MLASARTRCRIISSSAKGAIKNVWRGSGASHRVRLLPSLRIPPRLLPSSSLGSSSSQGHSLPSCALLVRFGKR